MKNYMAILPWISSPSLEGIWTRFKEGVHENAQYAYYGTGGYQQLLCRKDAQNEFYRLRGLNQAKTLLGKVTALSDHKHFVVAIASSKVEWVDHVLQRGLKQKRGINALLASLDAAAQGVYWPCTYTEKEDMRALLIWQLGGTRVAHINHCSQDAPSVSYLQSQSIVCPVILSPRKPMVEKVYKNVEATIEEIGWGTGSSWVHDPCCYDVGWDSKGKKDTLGSQNLFHWCM